MKKVLYVLLGILAIVILGGVYWLFNGMSQVKNLEIGDVNLTALADGTYRGTYQKGRWSYNVAVTVKDHAITAVEVIDNKVKMFEKINQEEIARVISRQSVKVDAVSGATVTSKALLKAIENALTPTAQ